MAISKAILIVVIACMSIKALAQDDPAARSGVQLGTALKDPEKAKLIECMGVKVYQDPQPVGHPPSKAECDFLSQKTKTPKTVDSKSAALKEYESKMKSPQRNVSLAYFVSMCGLRSNQWYDAFQLAYQRYSTELANRLHLSATDLKTIDEQGDKVFEETHSEVTCATLRNSSILDELDSMHRVVTGGYH
jgi:hypothetical protein